MSDPKFKTFVAMKGHRIAKAFFTAFKDSIQKRYLLDLDYL